MDRFFLVRDFPSLSKLCQTLMDNFGRAAYEAWYEPHGRPGVAVAAVAGLEVDGDWVWRTAEVRLLTSSIQYMPPPHGRCHLEP